MTSPPPSLASILYPPGQGNNEPTTSDEDGAALMTYLREAGGLHYNESGPDADPQATVAALTRVEQEGLNGSSEYRLPPKRDPGGVEPLPVNAPAPSSPIDTSVQISETLLSLSTIPVGRFLAPLSGLPSANSEAYAVPTDRGEMGGKRRKPLHERAGWKDMEEDEVMRAAKRSRGNEDDVNQSAQFVGDYNEAVAAVAGVGEGESGEAGNEDAIAQREAALIAGMDSVLANVAPAAEDDKPARGRGKLSKESRAEQNRKAQQIFRRRREEKMKQLEMDSAALGPTRTRLSVAEARIEQLALDLEAKTIEAQALRSALLTVATRVPTSIVSSEGRLTLTQEEFDEREKAAEGHEQRTIAVLDGLTRETRELAKLNHRARRAQEGQREDHRDSA